MTYSRRSLPLSRYISVIKPLMWVALVATLVLSLAKCAPTPVSASVRDLRLNVVAVGDTVTITARVTPAVVNDGRGPIESYRFTFTRLVPTPSVNQVVNTVGAATTATGRLPTATAVGGTSSGTVCVVAVRRTLTSSPPVCANWTATFADAPPPAPPSVSVDTVQLSAVIVQPKGVNVAASAQQRFCAFARMSNGKVYGVGYTDGTSTLSYPYCVNNYTTWFTMAERVTPLTLAVGRSNPFDRPGPITIAMN